MSCEFGICLIDGFYGFDCLCFGLFVFVGSGSGGGGFGICGGFGLEVYRIMMFGFCVAVCRDFGF